MNESMTNSAIPGAVTHKLRLVRQRKIFVQLASAAVAAVAVLLTAMALAMLVDWLATLYDSRWRVVLTVAALATAAATTAGWLFVAWRRALRWERVAGDVDRQMPQLEERWSTVTRLGEDLADPHIVHPAMFRRVASEAAAWEPHVEPERIVSLSTLGRAMVGLTLIASVLIAAAVIDTRQTLVLLGRFWLPASSISATELVDLPGDVVVGRGEPLALEATLAGRPVERATLFMRSDGAEERAVPLVGQGEPVAFAHRIRAIEQPFAYRFRAGDGQSEWYQVLVAERPEIAKLELIVTPPAYTGREAKRFTKLPRRVSALERSEVELAIQPTMPVQAMELRFDNNRSVVLQPDGEGWYRWTTTLEEGFTLAPILTEPHGLTNRRAPKCQFSVYGDKPPTVKILGPDDKLAVRPDDTIEISFAAEDDIGIGMAELLVYDHSPGGAGENAPVATIPIPLEDQQGARSIQGLVALDVGQFATESGVEISYEIRVRETRGGGSAATSSPSGEAGQDAAPPIDDMAAAGTSAGGRPDADSDAADAAGATEAEQAAASEPAASQPGTAADPNATAATSGEPDRAATAAAGQPSASADSSGAAATPPTTAPAEMPPSEAVAQGDASPRPETSPEASDAAPGGAADPGSRGDTNDTEERTASSGRRPLSSAEAEAEAAPSESTMAENRAAEDSAASEGAGSPSAASSSSESSSAEEASQSPGQSAPGSRLAAANSSEPGEPSESSAPSDNMPRRGLDAPQSSTSRRMRLKVDEYAGSFTGQQRAKLEMAIAPDLAALDKALATAQSTARSVLDELEVDGQWRGRYDRDVTSAERATVEAQKVITALQKRTYDTPYAFIGLQIADIGVAHVNPARTNLWQSLQSEGDERVAALRDAWQHLGRARQFLAELTTQFAQARREYELAESVERVKKMYQVYLENAMALLQRDEGGEGGDRYGRKMAEFDLDEEYLARLKEVLEMRRELQAELARILAEDPRLLRRFMDAMRNRSRDLREELAKLARNQEELNREVRAWTLVDEADRPRIGQILLHRQVRDATTIATAAGEMQARYQAWLPLDRESKDAELAAATRILQETVTAAGDLSAKANTFVASDRAGTASSANAAGGNAPAATNGEASPAEEPARAAAPAANREKAFASMIAAGNKLYQDLARLEVALRQIGSREEEAETALFATNRLADARRLTADTSAWIRQIHNHQQGKYPQAAEVEQYRLAIETDRLTGRLATIEQTLATLIQSTDGGLPEPIAQKARELLATLDEQASPSQLGAVYALRRGQLPQATVRQKSAADALVQAEKLYDEMMRLAIVEMDKLPVQDPIAQLLDDPTLDELLARLEQEQPLAELLGIPNRPSNLQIIGDWMNPRNNGMGGGGRPWISNQLRQEQELARQKLDEAYRQAIARALKEAKAQRTIALPRGTKLSDWNQLVSQLGSDVDQARDKAPPEQYRRAIEQYFAQISRVVAKQEQSSE